MVSSFGTMALPDGIIWVHIIVRMMCLHLLRQLPNQRKIGVRRSISILNDIEFSNTRKNSSESLPESYTRVGTVYVHWPYCRQRCSYCNFVKFIPCQDSQWTVPDIILEDAMVNEVKNLLKDSDVSNVTSVFFGGGTPSLARPQLVENMLKAIQETCSLEDNAEITLEGNPTSVETRKLKEFKTISGVNRVSIGVQALDEASLKLLNRDHSTEEALRCIDFAKKIFPGKVSLDLIFGRPFQSLDSWMKELEKCLHICDDHISLYQLTVERGTELHRQVSTGRLSVPKEDRVADMYEAAVSRLKASGLNRYEVSNFSRGQKSESSHNKSYWEGSQYVGVGPGAHSRVVPFSDFQENEYSSDTAAHKVNCYSHQALPQSTDKIHNYNLNHFVREARVNAADPVSWLNEVKLKGNGIRKNIKQTRLDVVSEYVTSGLRTKKGITSDRWSLFSPQMNIIEMFDKDTAWLQENDLLHVSEGGMKVSDSGLNVLDSILPYLLNIISRKSKQNR